MAVVVRAAVPAKAKGIVNGKVARAGAKEAGRAGVRAVAPGEGRVAGRARDLAAAAVVAAFARVAGSVSARPAGLLWPMNRAYPVPP